MFTFEEEIDLPAFLRRSAHPTYQKEL